MFRVNQRVCRVFWTKGVPFLRFGTVTKNSPKGHYQVDGKPRAGDWYGSVDDAIRAGYDFIFNTAWPVYRKNYEVSHAYVRSIIRLRRIERRLQRRLKKR